MVSIIQSLILSYGIRVKGLWLVRLCFSGGNVTMAGNSKLKSGNQEKFQTAMKLIFFGFIFSETNYVLYVLV